MSVPAPKHVFPNIIWTYWDRDVLPPVVQECIGTWTKWNPSYTVRVLTPKNVAVFVDVPPSRVPWASQSPQKQADYTRACVLAKYGGVWSDASIICTGPFPAQADMDAGACEFVGYFIQSRTTDHRFPLLENWWFAAAVGSVFMREWATAFTTTTSVHAQVAFFERQGVNPHKLPNKTYFLMHMAAQYVLQKVVSPDFIRQRMRLRVADERGGPLWNLVQMGKSNAAASIDILFHYLDESNRKAARGETHCVPDGLRSTPTLHKLISPQRRVLESGSNPQTLQRLLGGKFGVVSSLPPTPPPTHTRVLNVFIHPPPPTLAPGLWKQGDAHETRALQAWQEQNPAWKCVRTTLPSTTFIDGSKGLWLDATFTVMGLVLGLEAIAPLQLAYPVETRTDPECFIVRFLSA